jgi:predicted TIM-barrel fold metal-dependent hydrolase
LQYFNIEVCFRKRESERSSKVLTVGIVDVWAQIATPRVASQPWLKTLSRWTGRGDGDLETVSSTLAAMDAANVDIALLAGWHGPEGSLISNEEVADQIAQAPTRFRGLATVDLNSPMEAVRDSPPRRRKAICRRPRRALAVGAAAK